MIVGQDKGDSNEQGANRFGYLLLNARSWIARRCIFRQDIPRTVLGLSRSRPSYTFKPVGDEVE